MIPREGEARSQATRARSLRSAVPPVSAPARLRGRWPRLRAPWRRGADAPVRTITIDGGTLRDVIAGEVEIMEGDPIVRERFARALTRDCARRIIVAVLLAALDSDGRREVREMVEGWDDARTVAAGLEVLRDAWSAREADLLESLPQPPREA
jgi:hypothetical protein